MKCPKILSLTLANGIGFLVFGSILAGCQKTVIHKAGFFTGFKREAHRAPASVHKTYQDFQDPKQIFIYCEVNDLNPKKCYKQKLEESLSAYSSKTGAEAGELGQIKRSAKYPNVKKDIHMALAAVSAALAPSINGIVAKRAAFCEQNATSRLEKCLKQYLRKETFQALNKYQESASGMNGHEYLFLKNHIQSSLEAKLDAEFLRLQKEKAAAGEV